MQPLEFREIAEGVWIFAGTGDGQTSGIILGDTRALLVDPGDHPTDRRATERFLIEQGLDGAPIRFYTGNPVPPSSDAKPLVPRGDNGNSALQAAPMPGWNMVALNREVAPFARLGLHSPSLKLLFCGDLLTHPASGIPRLISSQDYLDSLARVESLDARLIIPLRGAPVQGKREIRARVEGDRNYVYSIQRHVLTAQVAGLPLDRALQAASDAYSSFPYLQDHLANLRVVWDEEM